MQSYSRSAKHHTIPPRPGEVVIRNHAVAINPVYVGKQAAVDAMLPWIKYPFVLGNDVSGTVVEVGEVDGATTPLHVKPGDRIVGLAVGISSIPRYANIMMAIHAKQSSYGEAQPV
ncbi:hypothetical protein F4808DRAFT_414519 [Astrocystis sublimbata]|nr:hypothetical protein F4808DRAFT_414519 [Astrocystis sublimbata]